MQVDHPTSDVNLIASGYRPDVDGLRAVAILSVIGFHAFPRLIRGGFVGVDIFFVISGFLISGLILKELQAGHFSFADFYARRVRRIFPALITVLATSLVFGAVLLPSDYNDVGAQSVAGMLFYANIFFWQGSGYFDAAAHLNPLLHLWSLGVEEQFYIVWPMALTLLYARTRRLLFVIGTVLLASFIWNVSTVRHDPVGAFYLPMSRFWELLMGAMLAIAHTSQRAAAADAGPRIAPRMAQWMSVAGLALISGTVLLLDDKREFPGWWALLPTSGAFLLIAARGSWLNQVVLCNPLLVWVGLISYPLYLWHWILLAAVQRHGLWHAPRAQVLGAIGASFALAWLTYKLIEIPIRSRRIRARTLAVPALVVAAFGMFIDVTDGATFRFPPDIQRLANFEYDAHTDYREGTCQLGGDQLFAELAPQCIDPDDGRSALLVVWGDSHASSLYQGLRAAQSQRRDFRLAQFTASGCPPLLGVRLGPGKNCLEFNQAAFDRIKTVHPTTVVMAGAWVSYARRAGTSRDELAALMRTIEQLKAAGVARVVVFGNLPVWQIEQPNVGLHIWMESHRLPSRSFAYYDVAAGGMDSLVAATVGATDAVFVSPIDSLCNQSGCLISTDPNVPKPVAWDFAHLTADGSKLLIALNAAKIFGGAAESENPLSVTGQGAAH